MHHIKTRVNNNFYFYFTYIFPFVRSFVGCLVGRFCVCELSEEHLRARFSSVFIDFHDTRRLWKTLAEKSPCGCSTCVCRLRVLLLGKWKEWKKTVFRTLRDTWNECKETTCCSFFPDFIFFSRLFRATHCCCFVYIRTNNIKFQEKGRFHAINYDANARNWGTKGTASREKRTKVEMRKKNP